MSWTIVIDPEVLDRALKLARGSYQTNLLLGRESLSGSTLKGKAADYAGHYRISRDNLLSRLTKKNIPWCEERHGSRRILVIGSFFPTEELKPRPLQLFFAFPDVSNI